MRNEWLKPNSAKGRVLTVALLVLFLHALAVRFTHNHPTVLPPAESGTTTLLPQSDRDAGPLGANSHSHCVSCHLQRNFVSGPADPAFVPERFGKQIALESFLSVHYSHGSFLILADRAPPLI
jgi:hypothetical protein